MKGFLAYGLLTSLVAAVAVGTLAEVGREVNALLLTVVAALQAAGAG